MRPTTTALFAGLVSLGLTTTALAESRDFDLAGFDRIDIATGLDATVRIGTDFVVKAESHSSDALDNLELSVENGVLVARIDSSFLDFIISGGLVGMLFNSGNAVSLDITVPALTGAVASSGADIDISGLTAETLELDASSGADISLDDARIGTLQATASSGSDIEISGRADRAELDASSGSDIDAGDLVVEQAQVNASSGGTIEAQVTEAVRANASSGANIDISGNPRQRDIDSSSGGDVHFDD